MATIGSFTRSDDGVFSGTIKTLTLAIKVRLVPVEKKSDKAPDLRVAVGDIEVGSGWVKAARDARLPHGGAGRSVRLGANLRQPCRRQGQRQLQPHLVPSQRPLT